MQKYLVIAIVALIAGGGIWLVARPAMPTDAPAQAAADTHPAPAPSAPVVADTDAMHKDTPTSSEAMMHGAGNYIAYSPDKIALAQKGKVVLFFHASWCPTCRNLDADIKAHLKDIPSDVTILDVDYDTSGPLKQKYGVTIQHTLVQVDATGMKLAKWTGSPTLADITSHII